MSSRMPDMAKMSPVVWKDLNDQATITYTSIVNGRRNGYSINGSDPAIFKSRTVVLNLDICTDQGRKIPVCVISLKVKVPFLNFPDGDEEIVTYAPITSSTGDVAFSSEDLKDTIRDLINTIIVDPDFGL